MLNGQERIKKVKKKVLGCHPKRKGNCGWPKVMVDFSFIIFVTGLKRHNNK
jgi:hypothetical protein